MQNQPLDDTQPNAPVLPPVDDFDPHAPMIDPYDEPGGSGPGCMVWGCVGLGGAVFAVFIVLLAGLAGWTSGQREANVHATATRSADIDQQLGRIPGDLSSGNLQLVDIRLRYLMTMTPGVPGVQDLASTATQAYLDSLPTATPTPTETPEPTEAVVEPQAIEITPSGRGQYDVAALLQDAQTAVNGGQYEQAWQLLDIIMAVDETFERQKVRELLTVALNGRARSLFNSSSPARGIVWATRAEDFGVIQGDVQFELQAALLWQNAQAAMGLNTAQAIPALQRVLDLGPGRYYEQAQTAMYQQYVAYGDALANDPNFGFCPAVPQYENALRVQSGGPAVAKRDNARTMCAQATPTPSPTPEGGIPEEPPPDGAPPEGQ